MNADPRTPEERLIWEVVRSVAALRHPNQAELAPFRADHAVGLWRQYGSRDLPAEHLHRGLFHTVGQVQERRESLGDRVHQALEAENHPCWPADRQAAIRHRSIAARARAIRTTLREVTDRER